MKKFLLSIILLCMPGHLTAEEEPAAEAQFLEGQIRETTAGEELQPRLPLNELRVFAEAFSRISAAYVEEKDDRTLLEHAIKGMLAELDPHSAYLDKDSFSELQEITTGNYGGLGIETTMEDGFVKVIAPMDDTPASRAGITSGDLIIRLNDTPVKGMNLSETVDVMRGEPGSDVKLTVLKAGESRPREITLTREIIKITSVRRRYIEEGFGYLRIAQFQTGTGKEVEKAITDLKDEDELEGLIIDLRNNPGGVLQAAVDVSDLFIDEGLIVYTDGRMDDADIRYSATGKDAIQDVPIVVLVNGGTASASEIVAGALQDHGRALIMGTNTFGKGSIQTLLPLNNEKAIKLTTALYYTPKGKSIQAEGISPDIWVDRSRVTPLEPNLGRIQEKNLPGHLPAEHDQEGAVDPDKPDAEPEGGAALASRDYQLNEALTLLKGLYILNRSGVPES